MTLNELAASVRRMRIAQSGYFKNPTAWNLRIAREHERRVDAEVDDVLNRTVSLFPDDGPQTGRNQP